MAKCKQCGANIPEFAKFCPKCGTPEPAQPAAQPEQPAAQPEQPAAPQQAAVPQQPYVPQQQPVNTYQYNAQQQQGVHQAKKPVDMGWLKNNILMWFIVTALSAYLISNLSVSFMQTSTGFGVFLGVMAILFDIAQCLVGVFGFISYLKMPEEQKEAASTQRKIIFAVSIVVFLAVLLTAICAFCIASDISKAQDALGALGNMFG